MNQNNKVSRNAPCPCGSGKKYKHCCLAKTNLIDLEWRRLRMTEGEVIDKHLVPYVAKHLPEDTINFAFEDFLIYREVSEEIETTLTDQMFLPWLLFVWKPMSDDDSEILDKLGNKTIALSYLASNKKKLTERQQQFILKMSQSYYSFYVVLDVIPNQALILKDIFLQTEHEIKEKTGTHHLRRGHIIFTQIVAVDNQSIAVGMSPYIIPSNMHASLINFRNQLEKELRHKLTPTDLLQDDLADDMRNIYFECVLPKLQSTLPEIQNTDGDDFLFCKVQGELTISPEAALKKLLPLSLSNDYDGFLQDAKKDKNGNIIHIDMPWLKRGNKEHKNWDNTVMGQIAISPKSITVEVNSEKRAKKAQKILAQYLQKDYVHKCISITSFEEMLKSAKSTKNKDAAKNISELPEAQEILKKIYEENWINWLHEKIPALDNKTPRTARKTKAGREKLEAILLAFEQANATDPDNPNNPDIDYLRKELNMPNNLDM